MKIGNIFAALLLLFCGSTFAQDNGALDKLYENLSNSCTEMTYTYSARSSGVQLSGEGTLIAQGLFWKLKGNGVEMYCDSTSMWVVDIAHKEVVIEQAASDSDGGYTVNPAMLLVRMNEMFKVREVRDSGNGKTIIYLLEPVGKSDIEYMNVGVTASGSSITDAEIALDDGNMINIKVSSMKLTPVRSVECFRPEKVFDSNWIVTDLR